MKKALRSIAIITLSLEFLACIITFVFQAVNLPDYGSSIYASPEIGMLLGTPFLLGFIIILIMDAVKEKKQQEKKDGLIIKILMIAFAVLGFGLCGVFGTYDLRHQFYYHYDDYFRTYDRDHGLTDFLAVLYLIISVPGWVSGIILIVKKFKKPKQEE